MKMSHEGVTILLTGGCGYIGSHTIVCLLGQGYNVVVADNLVNSSVISLDRVADIAKLSKEEREKRLVFHEVDVCDKEALRKVFESSPTFQACIHFAGLKVSSPRVTCYCLWETYRMTDSNESNPYLFRLSEKARRSL
jgi:UDP-glucose 4-epimerase